MPAELGNITPGEAGFVRRLAELTDHANAVLAVAFSPDGTTMATSSGDSPRTGVAVRRVVDTPSVSSPTGVPHWPAYTNLAARYPPK
jgi:WD40 repeat protein